MKLLALSFSAALLSPALAQESPVLTVDGAVLHPLTLTQADLRALPSIDVTVAQTTDHGVLTGKFHGVLLWSVIDKAVLKNGPEKNAYLRHTIMVSGHDDYGAVLAEGEIDPKLEGKTVIPATTKDGAVLAMPQLVVPGDAHASRAVHDVVSVTVQ